MCDRESEVGQVNPDRAELKYREARLLGKDLTESPFLIFDPLRMSARLHTILSSSRFADAENLQYLAICKMLLISTPVSSTAVTFM